MARPSVAAERTQQIIDATIRTIATHGITGTTLDRIAEEAGMSRGHVRHFVGNRDALLAVTARSFYFGDDEGSAILPARVSSVGDAIDYLFGEEFAAPGSENAVVFGLIEAGRTDPAIAAILEQAYTGAEETIRNLLAAERPDLSPAVRAHLAYGLVSMALHNVFMNDIQASDTRTADARAAAEWMLASA